MEGLLGILKTSHQNILPPGQHQGSHGRVDTDRLHHAVLARLLPRAADGRIVLAVDVTCWFRPEAHTSPGRIMCHAYGRAHNQHLAIPGWPYSIVAALETGRSSWTWTATS